MKLIDKLLLARIEPEVEKLLHEKQFAYRAHRNREQVWKIIVEWLLQGKKVFALDVSKAFDKVSRQAVINRLGKTSIQKQDLALIRSFITNRQFRIFENGLYKLIPDDEGTPQGTSLGPALFNVAMSQVIEQVEKIEGVGIVTYADDIFIYDDLSCDGKTFYEPLKSALSTINLHLNVKKS